MKRYDLNKVMRRAWEIKKQNDANIFGLCLRMAWEEVKMEGTEKTVDEKIEELIQKGFNRWTKGNMDRLYINAGQLGLICQYYNTGNIRSAEFNGDRVSNCEARRMKAAKTFLDIKTWTVYSDSETLKEAAEKLIAA